MDKFILTVTLNPAIDKIVHIPNFITGKDFREEDMHLTAGGKGVNVSEVLKSLNIPTMATGFIGGPDGYFIKNQLDRKKIPYNFTTIRGNSRTSLTIINNQKNEITRVLERGPTVRDKELLSFVRKYSSLIKNASYSILSGRNIPGAPDDFYSTLIKKNHEQGIPTVLDTSGAAFFNAITQNPWMIKPNISEAEEILQTNLNSESKIKRALECFYNMGIKIIALTLGSKGAIIYDGKNFYKSEVPVVESRSPVGCGDAFVAGFMSAIYKKKSITDAITTANACGAANATNVSPGFIKPNKIKNLRKEISIKII